MSSLDSFEDALERLRQGDSMAATEIYGRFSGRLIGLARQRLNQQMLQKVDPEDVLQSVFRSFFQRTADGQYEIEDWDGLWSLLVRITLNKCGRQIDALHTIKRDIRREVVLRAQDSSSRPWEALAREPTPDEVVALTDVVQQLMAGLDQRQQQVLSLRLQGHTIAEIGDQVGRTERSVHHVLAAIKRRMHSLIASPE